MRFAEKDFSKMVQLNSNFAVRYQVSPITALWTTDYGSVRVSLKWSAVSSPLVGEQTATLVDVLKSYDLSQRSSRSADANRAAAQSSSVAISTMLDASMDELFVPYIEGSRYLEKEIECLAELYMLNLYPFSRWHVSIVSEACYPCFSQKRLQELIPPGKASMQTMSGRVRGTGES